MTQLPEEAVGVVNDDPVIAAEPTLEDRLSAAMEPEQAEEEQAASPEAEAPELTVDDVAEEPEETPAIAPPASWKAEEQETFKQLPPDVQKVIAGREAEREKFVQAKSREAKQATEQARIEALNVVQQLNSTYAAQLQNLLPPIPPEPSPHLQADDPWAYADQLAAHKQAVAQHQTVQQLMAQAQQRQAIAAQQVNALEQQETHALLAEHFPEYLDPEQGPKVRAELRAVAIELGYSDQQLAHVDGKDILAMRRVASLKAKADKYDALMSQKMETVRAAKGLPKVSRPGAPVGKGARVNQQYAADRQAMRNGDMDAAARAVARFL